MKILSIFVHNMSFLHRYSHYRGVLGVELIDTIPSYEEWLKEIRTMVQRDNISFMICTELLGEPVTNSEFIKTLDGQIHYSDNGSVSTRKYLQDVKSWYNESDRITHE